MEIEIDVRFEADHEAPTMDGTRPMLVWSRHPTYGTGWRLFYADDPTSPTWGVEEHFIGGDLTDLDWAVAAARNWLAVAD